jgi:hypothetical protein
MKIADVGVGGGDLQTWLGPGGRGGMKIADVGRVWPEWR